jgi:geranylgeranyl diphosphate synthase, type I
MEPTPVPDVGSARLDDVRARVDAALGGFLSERRRTIADADPAAAGLIDELQRVIGAGGKRLRPLFCYWGFRAAGGTGAPEIVRAAASLELLHTFAIVHDDVMDRSRLRRGLPATHVALAHGADAHAGVSAAILAGDLALVLSDEMFCDAGFPPERFLAGFRWYNRMRTEVVAGQYLDLLASRGPVPDEEAVLRIARLKSGGYTVEKPLLIGAALAGAAPEIETLLSSFGSTLGEAFQLRDDVLGVFGDPDVTGKDVDGDLREGKRTLLVARAMSAASPDDRAFLDAHLGRADLTAKDAERIRDVIRATGALDATLETIERSRAAAAEVLAGAALDPAVATALTELADLAAARES